MSAEIDIRRYIAATISSIVLLITGFVTSNISYGVGEYVLGTFQSSLGSNISRLVQPQQIQIVGTALVMAGITLIVVTVSFMIRALMRIPTASPGE